MPTGMALRFSEPVTMVRVATRSVRNLPDPA
jgi:hypothetical protein